MQGVIREAAVVVAMAPKGRGVQEEAPSSEKVPKGQARGVVAAAPEREQ